MPTDKKYFFRLITNKNWAVRILGVTYFRTADYGRAKYGCMGFCFWFFEIEFYWKVEA